MPTCRLLSAAAVLAATTFGAGAEEAPNVAQFTKRMFAGSPSGAARYACFVRRYDAAHLARHPQQKVSRMKLLVSAEKVPEDEALNYSFRLGLNFRHRPGDFDSSGACGHAQVSETSEGRVQIGCSIDCDGGGLDVSLSHRTDAAIIRLSTHVRIWEKNNQPDEEAGDALLAGTDDRIFRLDRVGNDECRSLATDRKELAALRRK